MSATMPQPAYQGKTSSEGEDLAELCRAVTARLNRVDRLLDHHETSVAAGLEPEAANRDMLIRALLMSGYDLRTLGNGVRDLGDAVKEALYSRQADEEEHLLEVHEAEERGYRRGLAARRGGRHSGDRPQLNVVRGGGGVAGVAAAACRVSRHSAAFKLTAAAGLAGAGLSVATMKHLEVQAPWAPPARTAVMPTSAVPLSSSLPDIDPAPVVPLSGPPQGRHSRPAERNRATVLTFPAPAPAPAVTSPPPSSQDSSSSGQGASWQGDSRQHDSGQGAGSQGSGSGGGSQGSGWQQQDGSQGSHQDPQQQDQGNQGSHGNRQDHGNNRDQGNNQDHGNGWESYQGNVWTWQDWQPGSNGQGHGNGGGQQGNGWQGDGNGHGGGNGHGHGN